MADSHIHLPEEFIAVTRRLMGDERFARYLRAFEEDTPVSIRLNPLKIKEGQWLVAGGERVPWCPEGYYLDHRPPFTFDPLLHAGCYYVQEAASMFVTHVLRQYVSRPVAMLDLCAAPGGKSTAAIAALPQGSTLYSNEPMRQRASILLENITKWGCPGCTVTNNFPEAYQKSKLAFDVILCDVPCSGEGMFRRDAATIGEWSPQNVEKCWRLQRDIVAAVWDCLNEGGLMIYATCTFNTKENEENVRWICETYDAELLPVTTEPEWQITGSLLEGFQQPVYRFIPGITRSEGLFMAVLRKRSSTADKGKQRPQELHVLEPPVIAASAAPCCTVDAAQAVSYLRGEAIVLPPDVPRGIVNICFQQQTLGTAKNIGSRANNLYPKEWRIKTTHIPTDYEAILRHT